MFIEIDLNVFPPAVSLKDADDLRSFKVLVTESEHVYVPQEELVRLAGEKASDGEWRAQFERMLVYADEHGWVDDAGAIRAHVERADTP